MVKSYAATVEQYLDELPDDRRAVVSQVREVILKRLPKGYRETINWGMISYEVPLEQYPHTYNGQPLGYLALAAQKNYYALYMMTVYQDPEQEKRLREGFNQAGKKLDMGKCCIRFRKLEDIPLDVIGRAVASTPPKQFIALYESNRKR